MHTTWSLCLRRLSTAWLLGLLALGPFLHAHFGHASTEGFHVDGLQWHSHAPDDGSLGFTADDEHEAPAVGISVSLTRESQLTPAPHALIAWACTLILAVLPICAPLVRPRLWRSDSKPASLFQWAGHPPPCLAPPSLI